MKNKKAFEISFTTLFAIIVGAAILVLAVYGAMKIGNNQRFTIDTEIAEKILILTDPLQAGFAEGRHGEMEFKQETRINNFCDDAGFGKNDIGVSTKSNIGGDWVLVGGGVQTGGERVPVYNKYIFSRGKVQGKQFYVFSKPFYFPFKVSDLIFLTSNNEQFCFISPPDNIDSELRGMGIPNIKVYDAANSSACPINSTRVCFGSGAGSCNVNVYGTCTTNCEGTYDEGYVEKKGIRYNYANSLMYAAIFSEKDIYDCNVRRLMYRAARVSEVFAEKTDLMNARGCNSKMKADLLTFAGFAMNATEKNVIALNQVAKQVGSAQDLELCGVW